MPRRVHTPFINQVNRNRSQNNQNTTTTHGSTDHQPNVLGRDAVLGGAAALPVLDVNIDVDVDDEPLHIDVEDESPEVALGHDAVLGRHNVNIDVDDAHEPPEVADPHHAPPVNQNEPPNRQHHPILPVGPPLQGDIFDDGDDVIADLLHPMSMQNVRFIQLRRDYLDQLDGIRTLTCQHCNRITFITYNAAVPVCRSCRRVTYRDKFSDMNNMNPGDIPHQLQGLTYIEKLLIAQVTPSMSIFRLPRGGQFGFRGHVLNVPQNVEGFVTRLPRSVHDLELIVLRRGEDQLDLPAPLFTVNRNRVLTALDWLKANNPFYATITIVQPHLDALPENGLVALDHTQVGAEPDIAPPENVGLDPHVNNEPRLLPNPEQINPVGLPLPHTFVPVQHPVPNERQAIDAALENDDIIQWPQQHRDQPINEFTTVGYLARAFPCLFPTGAADIRAPRQTRVTNTEYFSHLLAYRDGRFQAEPRFVFLAYNSMLRWQSLQVGKAFVRNNPNEAALTVGDIRRDQRLLANRILRFGSQIRGTPQYWFRERSNLMSMIEELGNSTLFFTFSVADLQWPDLARFLDTQNQTTAEAIAHAPLTVDAYLWLRFDQFFKTFFVPYFDVKEYWFRAEWQHRGSLHIHGLAWLLDPPQTRVCSPETIVAYWNRYVTAWNPAIEPGDNVAEFYWPVQQHPCSLQSNDIDDLDNDLKGLVNVCLKHTRCSPGYCLRTYPDGAQRCRFGFPQPLQNETTVEFELDAQGNRIKLNVTPARNDPIVNKYNSHCLSAWRANMDISVTLDMSDVARYIAKYASKAEKSTTDYTAIFNTIVTNDLPPDAPVQQAASRLLLKTVGNMDISAQHAAHIISSLPLYRCSRQFVTVAVDGVSIQDELHGRSADIRMYMRRPAEHELLSLSAALKLYRFSESRGVVKFGCRRGEPAILRVVPKYSSDVNSDMYSRFCMQQLLLYKPFRQWDEVTEGFPDAKAAYVAMLEARGVVEDNAEDLEAAMRAVDDEPVPDIPEPPPQDVEPWMRIVDPVLDNRPVTPPLAPDVPQFDWAASSAPLQHLIPTGRSFLLEAKANDHNIPAPNLDPARPDPRHLNVEQRDIYNCITDHHAEPPATRQPLLAMVLGSAGTGKSFVIKCVKDSLGDHSIVLAPTGVAALNIGGSTIHSFLRFAKVSQLPPLRGEPLKQLQDKCRMVTHIIIDELSMIGCRLINAIDQRLRQAFPDRADHFFGGCSIILFGDLGQLAPVGDPRMFQTNQSTAPAAQGHAAYRSFTKVFTLRECVRQAGDAEFRDLLLRLRDGDTTPDDYERLSSRFEGVVPAMAPFHNAVRLFPTREAVEGHNNVMLHELGAPIAVIESAHNLPEARTATSNTACGLERHIRLSVGARIMLRANLWVERGLVNGSVGKVIHIVYSDGQVPPALPSVVVCSFSDYTGPPFLPGTPKTMAILPVRRTWSVGNGVNLSRTGLPLSLAWALTVHKSQGLTLPEAYVDIGRQEMSAGISFVAMSRVQRIHNLVLAPFEYNRLRSLSTNNQIVERKQEERRLSVLYV